MHSDYNKKGTQPKMLIPSSNMWRNLTKALAFLYIWNAEWTSWMRLKTRCDLWLLKNRKPDYSDDRAGCGSTGTLVKSMRRRRNKAKYFPQYPWRCRVFSMRQRWWDNQVGLLSSANQTVHMILLNCCLFPACHVAYLTLTDLQLHLEIPAIILRNYCNCWLAFSTSCFSSTQS